MTHIAVICEGKTEAGFVRDVLGSYFSLRDISVTPMHINTSPEHSGGSLSGQRVVRSTRTIANRRPRAYITTLFDLYGLPSDFPGVKDSGMRADPLDRAQFIEQCLKDAVITDSWEYPQRLIPYIQPYEFEALLFSNVAMFKEHASSWSKSVDQLAKIRDSVKSPEYIDGGHNSHPSARLQRLLVPKYRKARHGPPLAARIGIDCIRTQCQHFNEWLSKLEELPPLR